MCVYFDLFHTERPPIVPQQPAELSQAEPICSLAFHTPKRVHANTHEYHLSSWARMPHTLSLSYTHARAHITLDMEIVVRVLFPNVHLV